MAWIDDFSPEYQERWDRAFREELGEERQKIPKTTFAERERRKAVDAAAGRSNKAMLSRLDKLTSIIDKYTQADRQRMTTLADTQMRMLEQARQRELERQRIADEQKQRSLTVLEQVQRSRDELLRDVESAPSSVMQAARKAYEMKLQNEAALAGIRGTGFGETAEEKFGDQLGVADANLLTETATALRDENLQRQGIKRSILGAKAATAGQQYALSVGEGDQSRGYLQDFQNTLGGLMKQTGGTGTLLSGLLGQREQTEMGRRMFDRGVFESDRRHQLVLDEISRRENQSWLSGLLNLGSSIAKSFSPGGILNTIFSGGSGGGGGSNMESPLNFVGRDYAQGFNLNTQLQQLQRQNQQQRNFMGGQAFGGF